MKKTILSLLLIWFIVSCGSESTESSSDDSNKDTNNSEVVDETPEEVEEPEIVDQEPEEYTGLASLMLGKWQGEMGGKKIIVVIDNVTETSVSGCNIVGSNRRDLLGTWEGRGLDQPCATSLSVIMVEPGDDKWDGVFQFVFYVYWEMVETEEGELDCLGEKTGEFGDGEWKSNNGKLKHSDIILIRQ